jgi:hypothetical protein
MSDAARRPRRHAGRRHVLLAALLLPLATAAQEIEVIELRHRAAGELLPLLQPLVEPGGALTGRGYQLLLRASPSNRRQVRELLRTLDVPARQLVITVRQDLVDERSRAVRGADGSLVVGTRGVDGTARLQAGDARSVTTQGAEQRVLVREGSSAYIAIGTAMPMTFRQWVATPQGVTEVRGTAYYDAVTGFHARPTLAGGEVTLELSPEQSTVVAGAIDRAQLSTTVRGRLGEWIAVGGADSSREAQASGTLGTDRAAQSASRGAWVKVELDPSARP